MKLEDLRDLAIVMRQINAIEKRYSNSRGAGKRANELLEEYEDIFLTACETHREMVKRFLKKGDDD